MATAVRAVEPTARDEHGRKRCRVCQEWHPESFFYVVRGYADGRNPMCKWCQGLRDRATRYGTTVEQLLLMLEEQSGLCPICDRDISSRFYVDHDHNCCSEMPACGKCIRKLLCSNCNTLIGLAGESVDVLTRAIQHIQAGVPA